MTKLKIYFTTTVTTKAASNSEITSLINKHINESSKSLEFNEDYAVKAKSTFDISVIDKFVLSDKSKNGFEYSEITTELTIESHQLTQENKTHKTLNFTWAATSLIKSKEYEVISFLTDKKVICIKENDTEILFLDISNVKVYKA